MKRYMLFIFPGYYPSGGMNDFRGDFDTAEEAMKYSSLWFDPAVDWHCRTVETVHDDCFMHIYDNIDRKILLWKDGGKYWSDLAPEEW